MIRIRSAKDSDSNALIHLTGLTPMKGKISLRIDRRPDFFQLLHKRGNYIAIVAETDNNEIVGSFTAACQSFFVEQKEIPVYYLGDLKVHPELSGSSLAFRLVKKMRTELETRGADLIFCTAAEGNHSVIPFFSGKAGIPLFQNISKYNVYQLLPKKINRSVEYTAESTMTNELQLFYHNFYTRYEFRPSLELSDCIHFVKRKDGKIISAISVTDPSSFKQNVLIGYPVSIKLLLTILRILRPLFVLPQLPVKGSPLKVLYVKYWADTEFSDKNLEELISQARDFSYKHNYHFLTIATDEKDEWMKKFMRRWKMFVFNSNGLLASLNQQTTLIERIGRGITYEDFSLV